VLPNPRVTVSVLRMAGPEQISGAFRVEPELDFCQYFW